MNDKNHQKKQIMVDTYGVSRRDVIKGGLGFAGMMAMGSASGGIVKSMLGCRQGMNGNTKLPYDAEVEYLESTGTQYIDTGVIPNETIGADMDFMVSKTSSGDKIILMAGGDSVSWRWGFSSTGENLQVSGINAPGLTWQNFTMPRGIRHGVKFNYDNDYRCYLDGELIREDIPHGTTARNETIWINASYNGGVSSPWRVNSMKIYSLKMVDAGVLIRDYIPVRFTNELGQSEGAMYDRVSGQLFRNAGTGAFLYGGDVYSVPVETSQYVQDGLVAMWDGKENYGVGKRSPNATTWANIIDDSDIMTPEGTTFIWGDKSCSITNCRFINTNRPYIATISSTRVLTMEVVLNRTGGSVSFSQFISPSTGAWLKFESAGYGMGNVFYPRSLGYVNGTTSLLSLSVTADTILGYKDAVLKDTVANTHELSEYWNAMSIGGDISPASFVGQIFCCRLYSRALTADEIAANHAVDRWRFNLP